MIRLMVGLALCVLPTFAAAQTVTTGPVTTAMKVAWELPSNVPLSESASFEYRLKNGSALIALLTVVNCTGTTTVTCTAPITQTVADQLNTVGVHQLVLTLFRADVGESPASLPFTLPSPPAAPGSLKIIR